MSQNESAFKILVDKYQELVLNVCNNFLHNKEDAYDVSQEVFIEIYKSSHKFKFKSKLSTWIYRISVNKSLNYIRNNKKRSILKSIESVFFDVDTEQSVYSKIVSEPSKNLEYNESKDILRKALNTLAKNQKTVFILNKYEDLSYSEISEILNISVSNVGVLLIRAKKKLQKYVIDYYKNN